jgi:hypothetical protein
MIDAHRIGTCGITLDFPNKKTIDDRGLWDNVYRLAAEGHFRQWNTEFPAAEGRIL